MTQSNTPASYKELVARTQVPASQPPTAERDLDNLVASLAERDKPGIPALGAAAPDPIVALREMLVRELIPVFVELVEKYSTAGIALQMDASNLLEGGREIKFEFGISDHRTQLQGTVTADAIAFNEVRYAPDIDGQLVTGPMLRLRQLNAATFREFVCERLAQLIRSAGRRK